MKTIIITGSSRGIGLAAAHAFSDCRLVINCKSDITNLNAAAEHLTQAGSDVLAVIADLSTIDGVNALYDAAISRFGKIDVLVNNCGISHYALLGDMLPSDCAKIIDTNLMSYINLSRLVSKDMLKRKQGSIINISSVWGNVGAACETVYSASKGAVNAFTKALAKELAPSGIRVNAIACGVIDTGMNSGFSPEEKKDITSRIPLGRFGSADEVASLIRFLAFEQSNYITGQIITIDGGFTL